MQLGNRFYDFYFSQQSFCDTRTDIERELKSAGHSCWLDKTRISVGERFVTKIGMVRLKQAGCRNSVRRAIGHRWRVIVTSRSAPAADLDHLAQHLALTSFSERDTTILIEKSGVNPELGVQLFHALGGHPLSISLATRGMKRNAFTADHVLRIFRDGSQSYNQPSAD